MNTEDIGFDDSEESTPQKPLADPKGPAGRATDAAWGYKTGKEGGVELGFGFHQHTLVRVTTHDAQHAEPLLVDGIVITPANADVVEDSMRMVRRVKKRSPRFQFLLGDRLYTNLRASRWADPLARELGSQQHLRLSAFHHGVVDIHGAKMQHGWLHCPAADMTLRPIPPVRTSKEEWDRIHKQADEFYRRWAFYRKESGLGATRTSKWMCPAMGRVGCRARGPRNVAAAIEYNRPVVTPPEEWKTRACCTQRSIDFTPDPADAHHQRKLAQPHYVGTRRWKRATDPRTFLEGTFGILKNPSRQAMRRGQNRLPGIAMATIISGLKVALFNEEQLRNWHAKTGRGPVDHPILQPDPNEWGHKDLTVQEAKDIDADQPRRLRESKEPRPKPKREAA